MRSIFSSTVAVSLLLHAALGCCWHQAHTEAASDEPAYAAATCCHHEHGPAPADEPAHDSAPAHNHCHGVCTYLPAQKSAINQHDTVTSFELAAIIPAVYNSQIAAPRLIGSTCELVQVPPLRLHLLHQILLI